MHRDSVEKKGETLDNPTLDQDALVDRRQVLSFVGGAIALPFIQTRTQAAEGQFVLGGWGGAGAAAMLKAWGEPFENGSGLKFAMDGSGPTSGKVRAMVDAGKTVWDVCDASIGAAFALGEAGYLEAIDYEIIDRNLVRPDMAYKYAIANYIFSYSMTVDTSRFGPNQPKNWVDFWNVKDFPGKRVLRASCIGQLEGALMADGVPADKIYPIDVKRALNKIREIKEHAIFWKNSAQSEDLFRNKEVVLGNIWQTSSLALRREFGDKITFSFDNSVVAPAVWMVPKGNPAGKKVAMEFIKLALQPEGQKEFFLRRIGNSPSNPATSALIPDEFKKDDPGQPANYARQVHLNAEWYGKYLNEVEAQYIDIISS
ncbi:extracellular solute-binding protein [Bradyrhizobium sp. AZCC 2230]|uniref:extracellular solute-binding protein n=1 Tax=Bradyrhizobium sp. AZCC 2230 TaxID=3117021 RepID=UPI002FEF0730